MGHIVNLILPRMNGAPLDNGAKREVKIPNLKRVSVPSSQWLHHWVTAGSWTCRGVLAGNRLPLYLQLHFNYAIRLSSVGDFYRPRCCGCICTEMLSKRPHMFSVAFCCLFHPSTSSTKAPFLHPLWFESYLTCMLCHAEQCRFRNLHAGIVHLTSTGSCSSTKALIFKIWTILVSHH